MLEQQAGHLKIAPTHGVMQRRVSLFVAAWQAGMSACAKQHLDSLQAVCWSQVARAGYRDLQWEFAAALHA